MALAFPQPLVRSYKASSASLQSPHHAQLCAGTDFKEGTTEGLADTRVPKGASDDGAQQLTWQRINVWCCLSPPIQMIQGSLHLQTVLRDVRW